MLLEGFRGLMCWINVLVVDLNVPIGISAIVWVDMCWIVIVNQGNGPESGGRGGRIIRVPRRTWFLVYFFHLLLPDNCCL